MSKVHEIYKAPLPFSLAPPLPPIIPTNPITWIPYIYYYLFSRTPKQIPVQCSVDVGTLSCLVTDKESIKRLWTSGFFGKGNLSRSEPTWHVRTKRSLGLLGFDEDLVAEEITARRRLQRKRFKAQRAYREQCARQRQLCIERGEEVPDYLKEDAELPKELTEPLSSSLSAQNPSEVTFVPELEHLQLTFPEAFFLSSLGTLVVNGTDNFSSTPLLHVFAELTAKSPGFITEIWNEFPGTSFSQLDPSNYIRPDNTFLVELAAYYYFRQQGWVVKGGTKFSVDYLLYKRGPVFSHAELAILLLPCIGDYQKQNLKWHELHCLNRTIGQVKKTLVLCYVQCPAPEKFKDLWQRQKNMDPWEWSKLILSNYSIQCVTLRRWVPDRNRD
ncbi:tRNA-splicing endonuclease subunit catalytic subunit Sen2 [Schizosaccharomyces cryophilus OY26]|uniref:tRNA-splicing endonuclease subunit Sen2 n=1 Tax=Schizosaccharomyces cryophilus (strain OY26 / ATCC MYA-4695 / CBS 11777 / NBRC 106824 / NRRL Y48691) TaxID=653667 RepID=S9VSM8_SCHCR|nr:tRNA-splicing endonuclease subunit catalytic subunit Sen2 [Schizosaccharomyces cryophilus OY26]EPY50888.1 tRNA-splicing endonuclease subunit catalytic subunit Sen2 [Schizosaccharomyces cryophilus OY26]